VSLKLGDLPMHRRLDEPLQSELARLSLPLPSARLKLDPCDAHAELVSSVLAREGLELSQLRLKGLRQPFFSKGERAALCLPERLESQAAGDELHPKRQKLVLTFDLPRGSYATLIVKRITLPAD
jgi:tRNA pseudouridine13 synthase